MPPKIIIVTPNYANYGFLGKWSHCKSAKKISCMYCIYMFDRTIWDKLSQCIFGSFEIVLVKGE